MAPFLFGLVAVLLYTAPARADRPVLHLPIDCKLGQDCYVQQYVDRDTGEGSVVDFACGQMANDNHNGTDLAITSLAQMEAGVPVVAAAPGVVKRLRDGMPDIDALDQLAPDLTDRECGNGVAIGHGKGWETQYCHMREGSVMVEEGQHVDAGTPIGLVGMSGLATFPHVHFSVRHGKRVKDPFKPNMKADCGAAPDKGLWAERMEYRPGGLISAGILNRVPSFDEVKAGLPVIGLSNQPPAMVLWGYVFAGQAGDEIAFSMRGPGGRVTSERFKLEKSQPFLFRAWGKKAPSRGFAGGRYLGEIRHHRGDEVLDRRTVDFTLQ